MRFVVVLRGRRLRSELRRGGRLRLRQSAGVQVHVGRSVQSDSSQRCAEGRAHADGGVVLSRSEDAFLGVGMVVGKNGVRVASSPCALVGWDDRSANQVAEPTHRWIDVL